MKRILILIWEIGIGGAEKCGTNLSRLLSGEYQVFICVFGKIQNDYEYAGKAILLNLPGSKNIIKKMFIMISRIRLVRKIKKLYDIDLSISFTETPNFVNILSRNNDKVIASIREYKSISRKFLKFNIRKFLQKQLMKLLYKKADALVAVSKDIAEDINKNFCVNKKIITIPNFFYTKEIENQYNMCVKEEIARVFESTVIVNVGRLVYQKGQWHLIRVFAHLKKKIEDIKLVIIGTGELDNYLVKLSRDSGLRTIFTRNIRKMNEHYDVYFIPFVKNPFKYIRRAKLFALPSLWEGFPNALVEAMICRVPVVSSDCRCGPREILAPNSRQYRVIRSEERADYGVLLPVMDGKLYSARDELSCEENTWLLSIINLINDDKTLINYKKNGLIRSKEFSVDIVGQKWLSEIDKSLRTLS